ncbi:hypothetical protein JTE90_018814 [Oedothorax gibbosus]|uniref:EGF-like domain-containing protein n=1 Tax=Oedothorax gibbosus TaxID=931172 RepID=A0AAV6TRF1_9ARAC|nr:hypothetical protein JTE90_018814 [Oedothorax gibbosus]
MKNGKCEFCYCGEKGTCRFIGENKVCSCEGGYAEDKDNTGKCKECNCGYKTKTNSCTFNKGEKVCDCVSMHADKNGACTACDCGETTSPGCAFTDDAKTCKCTEKSSQKGNKCEGCDCGTHGICSFSEDYKKNCTCETGYSSVNKQGICKQCDCGANGKCSFDESNNRICECATGYKVNSKNECQECDCGANGKCSFDESNNRICECATGYKVNSKNECQDCDCGTHGICTISEVDKKNCMCETGYSLNKQGICEQCDCEGKGKCSFDLSNNRVCNCDKGYKLNSKNKCQVACDGVVCQNGASTCNNDTCGELLIRVNTEVATDPCFSNPCKNDGVCTVINSTDYLCECKQPFRGNHCERHPCHSNPCLNDGTCIAVENNYGCVCDEPFYGRHCENDPCTPSPCKNAGLCEVVGIDFNCTCKASYFGKQCEIEIDTTQADTTISDRITTSPVTKNKNEFNTTNSEYATTDYFSSEITTNTYECYCGENSVSCRLNWLGEKLCFCKDGYDQRRGTDICSRTCQSNADCRNDGICDRDGPGYFCLCREPFIGDRCELDVCNSVTFDCRSKGADCVRQGTIGVCKCPMGKKMSLYNYCEDVCTYGTCVHGTCELTGYDSSLYVCNCYEGYYGRHCENALVMQYTPAISILVILASGILLFSITSIAAGCWVKKLRKRFQKIPNKLDNHKRSIRYWAHIYINLQNFSK